MIFDLEDKKYIEDGILSCSEMEEDLNEKFEPWKVDRWLEGTRNERVTLMNAETMMAYNNHLDNIAYQALRANDINKAMKCLNLMRQLYIAAYNKGFNDTAGRLNDIINHRRSEIARAQDLRRLNNQPEQQARGGLFHPIQANNENESLNEVIEPYYDGSHAYDGFYKFLKDNNIEVKKATKFGEYDEYSGVAGGHTFKTYSYQPRNVITRPEGFLSKIEIDGVEIPHYVKGNNGSKELWNERYFGVRDVVDLCNNNLDIDKIFDARWKDEWKKVLEPLMINFDESLNEEVEIHDTLNPTIWNDDNTLKPEVAEKAKEVAQIFVDILTENGIKIKVMDIYLVGSNANYNYNESSDIDIHLIADPSLDCNDQHLKLIYDAYKTLFNRKYDISFKGINVEVYVEMGNPSTSGGVYSIRYDKWIKEPDRNDIPEIDQEAVGQGLNEWTKRYEEITASPTIEEIENYVDELYNLRINSIANEGEFGTGNLIFKEVRRTGILDKLKELKAELESKEMSLESLVEKLLGPSDKIIL